MTKFRTDETNNQTTKLNYQQTKELLNNLVPNGQGVLLDCIYPEEKKIEYPEGIAKPIPFLQAVNLEDKFMLIMLEYKLYFPQETEDREIALEIDKNNCEVVKEDNKLKFNFGEEEAYLKLHTSFDFPYQLNQDASLPTYSFIDWVRSPFI
jgi:hypothetical protein